MGLIDRFVALRDSTAAALIEGPGNMPPDVVRTLRYRASLFGRPFSVLTQAVMRGPSEWTVGERELFAAYVSRVNDCSF